MGVSAVGTAREKELIARAAVRKGVEQVAGDLDTSKTTRPLAGKGRCTRVRDIHNQDALLGVGHIGVVVRNLDIEGEVGHSRHPVLAQPGGVFRIGEVESNDAVDEAGHPEHVSDEIHPTPTEGGRVAAHWLPGVPGSPRRT